MFQVSWPSNFSTANFNPANFGRANLDAAKLLVEPSHRYIMGGPKPDFSGMNKLIAESSFRHGQISHPLLPLLFRSSREDVSPLRLGHSRKSALQPVFPTDNFYRSD
jgi:hypothetical protein